LGAVEALAEHAALLTRVEELLPRVDEAARLIVAAYERDGVVLAFGNGGSAADAQHLTGELVGRFRRERRPLAAIALSSDPSVVTCIANDFAFDDVFARQVEAHGRAGDVAVGYTTSGRSENVVRGLRTARAAGLSTVLFAGGDGGPAAGDADVALVVPSTMTARVQEMHLLLMHLVVEQVDAWAAGAGLTEPAGSGGSAGAGAGSSQ
jgi:D-sedoheptulose 7-phosphate isomerase